MIYTTTYKLRGKKGERERTREMHHRPKHRRAHRNVNPGLVPKSLTRSCPSHASKTCAIPFFFSPFVCVCFPPSFPQPQLRVTVGRNPKENHRARSQSINLHFPSRFLSPSHSGRRTFPISSSSLTPQRGSDARRRSDAFDLLRSSREYVARNNACAHARRQCFLIHRDCECTYVHI